MPPISAASGFWGTRTCIAQICYGQLLHFSPGLSGDRKNAGMYRVVRQLPESGSMLQYRIQSDLDGHERIVREDQISHP
jgi:hypothetical protein